MDQQSLYQAQAGYPSDTKLDARQSALLKTILRVLETKNSPAVTELSIGRGALSLALLKERSDLTLTGVDIAPVLIQHLSQEAALMGAAFSNRLRLLEANLDRDFSILPDDSADLIVAIDIMEHVFDVFAFARHCSRVLKASGYLILRVPNIAYITHRLRLLSGGLPVTSSWYGPKKDLAAWQDRYGWDGGHLHYFNLWSLKKLLGAFGIRVLQVTDAGARGEGIRNFFPTLLAGNLTLCCQVQK
jgi:cyclopropane fatty-acyl-phospholipid synthase-like methyltransferase